MTEPEINYTAFGVQEGNALVITDLKTGEKRTIERNRGESDRDWIRRIMTELGYGVAW